MTSRAGTPTRLEFTDWNNRGVPHGAPNDLLYIMCIIGVKLREYRRLLSSVSRDSEHLV